MMEKDIRQKVISIAENFLGCKESDDSHRKIIDIYNADKPLARGYTMTYTDAWCACFVSVVGVTAGLTDIILKEVSCNKMIELYKNIDRWEENDAYVPNAGDIIFYDWDDNGVGDNKGTSEHVGIVVSVIDSNIKVIEGNISNAVGYRTLTVNGKYIRGYGRPDYTSKATVIDTSPDKLTTPVTPFEPYTIRINTPALNIRKGPGTDNQVVKVLSNDRNLYTIVEEADGKGAKKWGKLKSGIGWISLDYTLKQ